MNNIQKGVGGRIRTIREQKDLTLEKLGERSGIHPSSISQIERGKRNLTLNNLARLADGLNVEPYQLLMFHEDRTLSDLEEMQFKVRELFEDAPKNKRDLLYAISRALLEWNPNG